jgi:hypothetical protein
MSSSNKSKSRSEGNEPVKRLNIVESERSEKPPAVVAINHFRKGQIPLSKKKPSPHKKPPLTSRTKPTKSDIHFHGDGRKTVDPYSTPIFDQGNPSLPRLQEEAAIETAKKKGEGRVSALIQKFEQRTKMGGKKTRKNKKSKKSKTRSKRC